MKDDIQDKKKDSADEVIDLRVVVRNLWRRKWLFVKVWIVTFVLACAYILPQPRTYNTSLTLAPEMGGQSAGGTLSSLASSFGFDLGSVQSEDAFYPELYPDVMATNEFLVNLLNVRVKSMDGAIDTTYLNYMTKHQQQNPLGYPFRWCKRQILSLFGEAPNPIAQNKPLDPRRLSKEEDALIDKLRDNITCDVDVKTSVITISVVDQDPLICVTMADSARVRLQDFITTYRTSKARNDMDYYKQLADSARKEYEAASHAYSDYCDRHQNAFLQAYVTERDELENVMSTKLSTYNAMQAQYQAAKAKVQERTPAFTILQSASVPVKATSPKRMIFVAAMLFLAFIGTSVYIYKDSFKAQLMPPSDEESAA